MRYTSRTEAERIGQAGAYWEETSDSYRCRGMSSFWINCEKDDTAFTPHLMRDGFWESWILTWFSNHVNPGDNFYDVGANVGFYTLWAATHGCRVVAFEPNPKVAKLLYRSVQENGFDFRVDLEQVALSDDHGTVDLWIPEKHSGAASIAATGPGEIVQVQTWRLDDIYLSSGRTVLKIDAEGAEPQIWAGMQENWVQGNCIAVMEWQKDRYDARAFSDDLYDKAEVSIIDTNGNDYLISQDDLVNRSSLEMIVLRSKK